MEKDNSVVKACGKLEGINVGKKGDICNNTFNDKKFLKQLKKNTFSKH